MPIRTPPPLGPKTMTRPRRKGQHTENKAVFAFMARPPHNGVLHTLLCSAKELDRTVGWKAGKCQFFSSFHYRQNLPSGIMLTDFVTFEQYS